MKKAQELRLEYRAANSAARRMHCITEALHIDRHELAIGQEFVLEALSNDADPIVRHEAAFVLGDWRSREFIRDEPAAGALCKLVREDRSVVVRHEAVEALQWFGGLEVDDALVLARDDAAEDVRLTVEIVLARRQGR